MYTTGIYLDYISLGRRMVYQATAEMNRDRREALREPADSAYEQSEELADAIIAARRCGNIQESNDHGQALEELARDMGVYVQHVEWLTTKEK